MPQRTVNSDVKEPNGQESQECAKPDEDVPACQSCRKKKARCSRAQPCDQCQKFNVPCVYDDRRMKPGLRAGAVDQLYRRIETLENMFLGQEMLWQQMIHAISPGLNDTEPIDASSTSTGLEQRRKRLKDTLLRSAAAQSQFKPHASPERTEKEANSDLPPRKIRRVDNPSVTIQSEIEDDPNGLLPPEIMNELVDFYYLNIHHWIPILHVRNFRKRMESKDERPRITCILHAIIAVCVRFSQNERLQDEHERSRIAEKSRQRVILNSIETFSVENLQALIIVAFETIGRGRGPSSWSIIGNMVGTVEQLQLNAEEDELYCPPKLGETLIRRMLFLTPSKSWWEVEERRRVFWAVFLMDRFCSVSTGWKMSLASSDIKRRLPCEGAHWEKAREICTPFFGIPGSKGTFSLPGGQANNDQEDRDSIGGLAYNIEATESLSLVADFFLRHEFVIKDTEKAQLWLMKFKELDLRLLQWKLYLPLKWREASVLNSDGVMDPNLTLAHITHNTAVILLHQGIAYPPAHWQKCAVKPPSALSAETCLEAASEIARIGQQFLTFSPIFTNPQFSFCLFIAGRMLLAHSRYNQVAIPAALDTLIASLLEISQRWSGPGRESNIEESNLAASFAKRLIDAQSTSVTDPCSSLDIRQTAYSDESKEHPQANDASSFPCENDDFHVQQESTCSVPGGLIGLPTQPNPFEYDPFSLAFPPLPPAFQQDFPFTGYPQGAESQPSMRLAMQQYPAHNFNLWHDPEVLGADTTINLNEATCHSTSSHTPSPGQRISRYGGA